MLVKLSPGVNFINVLQAAFAHADPKSVKETIKLSVFFALLGSASVKATRRTLIKLTPGRGVRTEKGGRKIKIQSF